MPKFPDILLNNNPDAPSVDLNDLQVKGVGIFADATERDALNSNLHTEGYLAIMKDTNTVFVYLGGTWTDAANWQEAKGVWEEVAGTTTDIKYENGVVGITNSVGITEYDTSTHAYITAIRQELGSTFPGGNEETLLHLHNGNLAISKSPVTSTYPNAFITLKNGFHGTSGGYIGLDQYDMTIGGPGNFSIKEYDNNGNITGSRLSVYSSSAPYAGGVHPKFDSTGLWFPGGILGSPDMKITMGGSDSGLQFYTHTSGNYHFMGLGVENLYYAAGIYLGAVRSGKVAYIRSSDSNTDGSYGYVGVNVNNPTPTGPAFEVSSSYAKFNDYIEVVGAPIKLHTDGAGTSYDATWAFEQGTNINDSRFWIRPYGNKNAYNVNYQMQIVNQGNSHWIIGGNYAGLYLGYGASETSPFAKSVKLKDGKVALSTLYLGPVDNPNYYITTTFGSENQVLVADTTAGGAVWRDTYTNKYKSVATAHIGNNTQDVTNTVSHVESYYTRGFDGDGFSQTEYTGVGVRRLYFSNKFNADASKIEANGNPEGWYAIDLAPVQGINNGNPADVFSSGVSGEYWSQTIENSASSFKDELYNQLNTNENIEGVGCSLAVAVIPTKFAITTTTANETYTIKLSDGTTLLNKYLLGTVDWGDSSSTSFAHSIRGIPQSGVQVIGNLDGETITEVLDGDAIWTHTYATAGTYTVTITGPCAGLNFVSDTQVTEIRFGNQVRFGSIPFDNTSSLSQFKGRMLIPPCIIRNASGQYVRVLSSFLDNLPLLNANQDLDEWFSPYEPVECYSPFGNGYVDNIDTLKVGKYIQALAIDMSAFTTTNLPSWNGDLPYVNFDLTKCKDFRMKYFAGNRLPIREGKEPTSDTAIAIADNAFENITRFDLGESFDQLTKNTPYGTGQSGTNFWRAWGNTTGFSSFGKYKIAATVTIIQDLFTSYTRTNIGEYIPFFIAGGVQKARGGADIGSFKQVVPPNVNTDVSGVEEISDRITSLQQTFDGASHFTGNGVEKINTINVTSMSYTFRDAARFNGDVSSWYTSNVTTMIEMFKNAYKFNRDIGCWDTSNVTTMDAMFERAYCFNQDISGWDTSLVTDMSDMFKFAGSFDQPIGSWNVSAVTNMHGMFEGDIYSNLTNSPQPNMDLNSWNTSNVTDMSYMFAGAQNYNPAISQWDTSSVTDFSNFFQSRYGKVLTFDQDLSGWDVSSVITFSSMFSNMSSISSQNLANSVNVWSVGLATTNISSMFSSTASMYLCDLSGWNTTNLVSVGGAFNVVGAGENLGLENWNTSSIAGSMAYFMRNGQMRLLPNEVLPSCTGYTGSSNQLTFGSAVPDNWTVGADLVFRTGGYERGASKITAISVGRLTVTVENKANDMWSPAAVTAAGLGYRNNPDLSGWDMSRMTSLDYAFENCDLNQDFSSWNLNALAGTNTNTFVRATYSSVSKMWIGWSANANTATGVTMGFGSRTFSLAATTTTHDYDGEDTYGGYLKMVAPTPNANRTSGTNTSTTTNKLVDSGATFTASVSIGDVVENTTAGTYAKVNSVDNDNELTLSRDIFTTTSQAYSIDGGLGWVISGVTFS